MAIDIVEDADGQPSARFTVESAPPLGFGRVQLELGHLRERWEPVPRDDELRDN